MTDDDAGDLRELLLLTIKPVMYVANVERDRLREQSRTSTRCVARAQTEGAPVVPVCAAIEAEIAQLEDAEKADFLEDLGLDEPGLEPRHPRGLPAAGPADLLHRRAEGSPRVDGEERLDRAAGRGRHPHRLRARLHPRRGDRATTTSSPARARRARRKPASCASKARSTSCRKATSCTSGSTSSAEPTSPRGQDWWLSRVTAISRAVRALADSQP